MVQALETAHPERRAGWRIELPAPGEALVVARHLRPQETAGRAFAPLLVSADANNGQVVASRLRGDTAMTWLYDLHYTLLLDSIGRQAVALAGVALVLSAASGLWLWWPAAGHWQQALRFKRDASPPRRVYDLHRWGGLLAFVFVLVLGVTGSVPGWTPAAARRWRHAHRPTSVVPMCSTNGCIRCPAGKPSACLDALPCVQAACCRSCLW